MDVYIIRHGQTDWNIVKKLQGTEDIPLNDTGRRQAAICAQALSGIPFEAIYTSPLSRAAETAQIISDYQCHAPVIVEPGLIERCFGEGSGMTYEQLHSTYPEYPQVLPKGMEEFNALSERVFSAVRSCAEKHHDKPILLVSHGASINAFLHRISNGACGTGITWLKNTCISKAAYSFDSHTFTLLFHNLSPEEFCDS
ncbi:MAG: histidine phosphatase family protein [Lachnospiraceae bacterium]|nr:histidine phosphatase family protein [Lachnospiraceae bacterium]